MGFKLGGQQIHVSDFSDVLDLLGGESPWKSYITPNLSQARKSPKSFSVLPADKFKEKTKASDGAAGWTNKQTGEIVMLQWGPRADYTYLLAALHECVHLVSDPAKQGAPYSTARTKLGSGVEEGLVECITEDVLTSQQIALPVKDLRGYADRIPLIRALIDPEPSTNKNKNLALFADVLFKGSDTALNTEMEFRFGKEGWTKIKGLAGPNPELASKIMDSERKKAEQRRANETK